MQQHLRHIRQQKGLTLSQAALLMGTSKGQLSKLERGLTRLTPTWLEKCSTHYHCSIHQLIDDAPSQKKSSTQPITITATMCGTITHASIDYLPKTEQCSLVVTTPESVKKLKRQTSPSYLALTTLHTPYLSFAPSTQLIFAKLSKQWSPLLHPYCIVIAKLKDTHNDIICQIKHDRHGVPQAYHYNNQPGTTKQYALFGTPSPTAHVHMLFEMDQNPFPKYSKKRPIPLINEQLDIKAILVKSIHEQGKSHPIPPKRSFLNPSK